MRYLCKYLLSYQTDTTFSRTWHSRQDFNGGFTVCRAEKSHDDTRDMILILAQTQTTELFPSVK